MKGYVSQNFQPDISNVAKELNITNNGSQVENWRQGRRVVELGVLADGLSGCKLCGIPLHLSHAQGIITYGLSAILKVPCSNTQCMAMNNISTGKDITEFGMPTQN